MRMIKPHRIDVRAVRLYSSGTDQWCNIFQIYVPQSLPIPLNTAGGQVFKYLKGNLFLC